MAKKERISYVSIFLYIYISFNSTKIMVEMEKLAS
jgi:hypothetical protein